MSGLRVLAVASEMFPLVKTGGLADVTGALPLALAAQGIETVTMVPGYPAVLDGLADVDMVAPCVDVPGGVARLLRGRVAGLEVMAVDAPHLFARPGGPYSAPGGQDWPDNAARFAGLARAAAMVAQGEVAGFTPDVLHAHDWQAGLAMAYLRAGPRPGTVMTVHNLAFQGLFPADLLGALGLPVAAFTMEGIEFHGMIGFLKAGLALADRITTVSPTYAAEIQTQAGGMGLDGLLRARTLAGVGVVRGILNGIDETVWDPATDRMVAAPFNVDTRGRRRRNKAVVQRRFGLSDAPEALLLGVISRLTWQKGLDLLLEWMGGVVPAGIQLAVLGAGDAALEAGFEAAGRTHAGRIGCVVGYDEGLAHQMQAGLDGLLVPSRFEPCGLTQLCAMRYGALPVVARVGGLADTVIDANEAALAAGLGTGIQYGGDMLGQAISRTADLWRQPEVWDQLQRNAMLTDVSWARPAAQYAALYREVARR